MDTRLSRCCFKSCTPRHPLDMPSRAPQHHKARPLTAPSMCRLVLCHQRCRECHAPGAPEKLPGRQPPALHARGERRWARLRVFGSPFGTRFGSRLARPAGVEGVGAWTCSPFLLRPLLQWEPHTILAWRCKGVPGSSSCPLHTAALALMQHSVRSWRQLLPCQPQGCLGSRAGEAMHRIAAWQHVNVAVAAAPDASPRPLGVSMAYRWEQAVLGHVLSSLLPAPGAVVPPRIEPCAAPAAPTARCPGRLPHSTQGAQDLRYITQAQPATAKGPSSPSPLMPTHRIPFCSCQHLRLRTSGLVQGWRS